MAKHRWFALAVGLVLAMPVVAGCATPTGSGDRPADSAGDPNASASAAGSPGSTATTKAPGEEDPGDVLDPQQPGTPKTLRGTPSEGVEAGCIVMQADDGNLYLLLGGDRALILSGARLEVSVLIQKDLMTTCQQGTPAVVQTARKI